MIDRRQFLATTGTALAATLAGGMAKSAEGKDFPWKKGFMLGGLKSGKVEPTFRMLKDAGFDGVELISPNDLDTDEVLKARDSTGLVIHGVSGSKHWGSPLSDPNPKVVEEGLEAVRREVKDC